MTRTRWTLRDWEGGRLDHRCLYRFVIGLGADSAFFAAIRPDEAETIKWLDGTAQSAITADLIDTVREVGLIVAAKGTGKRPHRLKPYPRPWLKARNGRRYGKDAIPVEDFNEWYYGGDGR